MYNQIPKYQLGKALKLIEEVVSKTKGKDVAGYIGKQINFLGKNTQYTKYKEGLESLRNLYKTGVKYDKSKGVTEGTNKQFFEALQKIAEGRRELPIYKERRAKFFESKQKAKETAAKAKKTYVKPSTSTPDEATLRAIKAYFGETPKPKNVVTETAAKASDAVQGRYAKMKQAMKNHPWITGAALVGLTNGTTRNAVGTGLQYYLTPYNQWGSIGQPTQSTPQQLRLNDGSIVPVTMGEDGVLTIGQPSQETMDPTDAAIAQAIAQANIPEDTQAPTPDSVGSYTTNEDFNDIFENDAWDQ